MGGDEQLAVADRATHSVACSRDGAPLPGGETTPDQECDAAVQLVTAQPFKQAFASHRASFAVGLCGGVDLADGGVRVPWVL
jgi:hypothetical protein